MTATIVIPIRSFEGMTRLAHDLTADQRRRLSRELATRVVRAAEGADLDTMIVTADAAVRRWATDMGARVVAEPAAEGLNEAAAVGIASVSTTSWLVVHSDLPAITTEDLDAAAERVRYRTVLAPSHDGGTPLIGSTGSSFPFRYGRGSFRSHLSAVGGDASILIRAGLALDLDRPSDLRALTEFGYLSRSID
ncbi:MAG: 2-phospho-L-lactate guanylyltransferase [Acidimicrobiia bacterium]